MNKEILATVVEACKLHLSLLTKEGTKCPTIDEMRKCINLDDAIKLFDSKLKELDAPKKAN